MNRLPVEGTAQGFAAEEHNARYLELWNFGPYIGRIHYALYVALRCASRRDERRARQRDYQLAKPRRALKERASLDFSATTRARVRLEGACNLWRKILHPESCRLIGRVSDRVVRPLRPGNAGGGKDPDFWCAFEVGEVRVIGDEP